MRDLSTFEKALSPIISGCLPINHEAESFEGKINLESINSYRPLYRAVYNEVKEEEIVDVELIAHYIGLSTLIFGVLKPTKFLLIAHYIGLSTN